MMKKCVMALIAIVAAAVVMAGCSKMGPAGVTTFKSPDGMFTVDIPARYKEMKKETSQIDTATGPKTLTAYTIDAKDKAYIVSFMDLQLPPESMDIRKLLEGNIKGMAGEGGKVLSQKDTKLDNMLALEVDSQKKFEGKDLYVRAIHSYMDGKQIQVQIVSYNKETINSTEMRQFLSSFKYTGWKKK